MDSEHIKELEIDVADAKKAVEDAEIEVQEALNWHRKMLTRYANEIINLDKAKNS